jgi:hypothetical protein
MKYYAVFAAGILMLQRKICRLKDFPGRGRNLGHGRQRPSANDEKRFAGKTILKFISIVSALWADLNGPGDASRCSEI